MSRPANEREILFNDSIRLMRDIIRLYIYAISENEEARIRGLYSRLSDLVIEIIKQPGVVARVLGGSNIGELNETFNQLKKEYDIIYKENVLSIIDLLNAFKRDLLKLKRLLEEKRSLLQQWLQENERRGIEALKAGNQAEAVIYAKKTIELEKAISKHSMAITAVQQRILRVNLIIEGIPLIIKAWLINRAIEETIKTLSKEEVEGLKKTIDKILDRLKAKGLSIQEIDSIIGFIEGRTNFDKIVDIKGLIEDMKEVAVDPETIERLREWAQLIPGARIDIEKIKVEPSEYERWASLKREVQEEEENR